jgi:hypothetical protein
MKLRRADSPSAIRKSGETAIRRVEHAAALDGERCKQSIG